MTSEELKDEIDIVITNETSPASITPTDVGGTLKLMVDYVDQEVSSINDFTVFRGKITKSGSGSSATFSFNVLENTTGKTFVCTNDTQNAQIKSSDNSNFLTTNSIVRVDDNSYLNTVITKHSIGSLSQVTIFSYYNGSQNINFTDDIDVEFIIYP